MKILFISLMQGFPWGGSEDLWYRTARLAIAQNHSVLVSVKQWDTLPNKIEELENLGATIHLRQTHKPIGLWGRVKNKIKGYRNKFPSPYAALESFNPGVVVVSQGNTFSFASDSHLRELLYSKRYIIISQWNSEFGILPIQYRESAINLIKNARAFVFVSYRNLHVAQRQIAYRIENSTVIYNPVNLSKKEYIAYPTVVSQVQFACVARLDCDYKGQDLLFEALSADNWKERSWRLNLYGTGPDLNYLKELALYFGIADKIIFAGHVACIEDIWKKNHILLLPSHSEGSSLSLMEAMMCGRCAVVTDVGANTELINNTRGFVAAAPTVSCIGRALDEAWNHRHEWEALGLNAYNFVKSQLKENSEELLMKMILNP